MAAIMEHIINLCLFLLELNLFVVYEMKKL